MAVKNKKILLVEDDPLIVEIYTTRFAKTDIEMESVFDGEQALKILEEKKYDLILLDIVLPRLTGFEFLQRVNEAGLKDLKILILSNLGQKSDIARAKELGAIKYLIKAHYTPSEVVEEVKKVLMK